MGGLPGNLLRLHTEEERIREESLGLLGRNDVLRADVIMIELCMDMFQCVRTSEDIFDADQEILAMLSASVFNSIASSLKLVLSGYYQAATIHVRYLLETGWLFDYFGTDRRLISEWSTIDEKARDRKFGAVKLRTALDDRDGFCEMKRMKRYKDLCAVSGHPSVVGFSFLRPDITGEIQMQPFFTERLLGAFLRELAFVCVSAWNAYMPFFPPKSISSYQTRLAYLECFATWFASLTGGEPDLDGIAEVKQILSILQRGEKRN